MAGILCSATTDEVATGIAGKTLLQLVAATNQRVKVVRWGVSFDGVAPTDQPIKIKLLRQTTAGTMSVLTPINLGVGSEILQTTAQHTATVEPTYGDIIDTLNVHPQSGFEIIFPLGQELIIPGGGRIGIYALADVSVNAISKFIYEE